MIEVENNNGVISRIGEKTLPKTGYKYPDIPTNTLTIQQSVAKIIEQGTLEVVYQPIVDHSKSVIFAHEALSRPQFDGTFFQPDTWFRTAYECNRSLEADLLAINSSMNNLRLLPHEITSTTPLFVNVMPSSLAEKSFYGELEHLFRDDVCQPEQLVLEIIEYVSYDPLSLSKMVDPIRSMGVRVALDDVGTGNASLEALVQLVPDFIKVDRCLIQGISQSSSQQRLLSHLVGYMESENSVIAEGLENAEDLLAIKETGVHLSQGFYWAHPMSADNLLVLLTGIEIERNTLVEIIQDKGGKLTDEKVVKKSQELDLLITQYCHLRNR